MHNWFEEFCLKSQDYETSDGNVSESFALMGQYMKLTDKIRKLKRKMWDEQVIEEAVRIGAMEQLDLDEYNFEGPEEILRDIIGHCFLALDFLQQDGGTND